jgi:tetratricopeptide (TPR) repeat protein
MKGSISLASENRPAGMNDRWLVLGVCIFLAAMVWVVFGQTLHHEFVSFDDNLYVYENPVVQKGLTWEGFCWALTYGQIGHWHPLTWLSHMLDCQLYGLNAGGHHLTNVLLHTASVILLFLVLRRMTGFPWRSAFVAAVFAIHPLRAESVAWVAERKDVLSAFFFMLTLGAYVRYVQGRSRVEGRAPSAGSGSLALDPRLWTLDYGLVVLFFALGLLSKNMLVTMPFVLLLLDYWPLGRLSSCAPRVLFRLVAEKIPLFVLTVVSCVATAHVPEKLTADKLSFGLRMENAAVSYVTYLWQMIHPSGLACLYPHPVSHLPVWQVVGAVGLLLAISGAAWALRQTYPWLVVGWLWYLGMMIPVIGLVQISFYAHADRYTYLPQIGLYLLLTWAAADLLAGWRHRRWLLGGLATVILVALIFCAHKQTTYWRNSELLWIHTLACTSDNAVAHYNLGTVLLQKGSVDEALVHFQKGMEINPGYLEARNNLGIALRQKGRVDEAIAHFQKVLEINPGYAEARINLGNALLQQGRVDEAVVHYQKALQIKPDSVEAHINLGNALLKSGRTDEAITHYQRALQIKPDFLEVLNNLAWLLATCPDARVRDGALAVKYAERACELTHYDVIPMVGTLAAAYAEAGRFDDAISTAQKACALASASGERDLLERNQKLLALYRAHQPYHEPARTVAPAAPRL